MILLKTCRKVSLNFISHSCCVLHPFMPTVSSIVQSTFFPPPSTHLTFLAMHTMGFDKIERENILSVTSALLHCSNLDFIAISADECEIKRDSSSLEPILSLLGFTVEALNRALCYFSIKAGKETHTRSLPKAKAAKGLLGLIKGNC